MILKVSNLEAAYNKLNILFGVSLHVKENECVAIIGPNGAGKSTVLKSIMNTIPSRKGTIEFDGKNISNLPTEQLISLGIGYVPQGRAIFPSLTVKENLEMGAYLLKNKPIQELDNAYAQFPILKERKDQKAALLSGGEQQMLAIARALMLKPKLILLDEPSLGLSPAMKSSIFEKILEVNKAGTGVLVVEQNARLALQSCHRAYVLEAGRNKLEGSGKNLLKDKKVQHLYLGGIVD